MSIAIDGPAGAGKSTVAREVAKKLGLLYVDTGAMYRAVAYLALQEGVNAEHEAELVSLCERHCLQFEKRDDGMLDASIDGENVTHLLRSPNVNAIVSQLSVHPRIRSLLTNIQRDFRERHGVVMDGRDIGTVVMPDADLKVFLTASLEERARRRATELASNGHTVDEQALRDAISSRDQRDASRSVAPLKPAADAHVLDSTGRTVDDMVTQILSWVRGVSYE